MHPRCNRSSRATHLWIALSLLIAEILVGTVFKHVSFVRSHMSDFLVVMLLYHVVQAFSRLTPARLAILVFTFACLIELFQAFHQADALGLRRGGLLSVLLGNSADWIDVLMYALGCLTSYGIGRALSPKRHLSLAIHRTDTSHALPPG